MADRGRSARIRNGGIATGDGPSLCRHFGDREAPGSRAERDARADYQGQRRETGALSDRCGRDHRIAGEQSAMRGRWTISQAVRTRSARRLTHGRGTGSGDLALKRIATGRQTLSRVDADAIVREWYGFGSGGGTVEFPPRGAAPGKPTGSLLFRVSEQLPDLSRKLIA